jgi:hypothetical protein
LATGDYFKFLSLLIKMNKYVVSGVACVVLILCLVMYTKKTAGATTPRQHEAELLALVTKLNTEMDGMTVSQAATHLQKTRPGIKIVNLQHSYDAAAFWKANEGLTVVFRQPPEGKLTVYEIGRDDEWMSSMKI